MTITVSGINTISPISTGTPAATPHGDRTATTPQGQPARSPVLAQNLAMLGQLRRQGGAVDRQDAAWEPPRSGSASGL